MDKILNRSEGVVNEKLVEGSISRLTEIGVGGGVHF